MVIGKYVFILFTVILRRMENSFNLYNNTYLWNLKNYKVYKIYIYIIKNKKYIKYIIYKWKYKKEKISFKNQNSIIQ